MGKTCPVLAPVLGRCPSVLPGFGVVARWGLAGVPDSTGPRCQGVLVSSLRSARSQVKFAADHSWFQLAVGKKIEAAEKEKPKKEKESAGTQRRTRNQDCKRRNLTAVVVVI